MASASIVAAEAEAEVDCSDTERAAPLYLTGIAAARGSTSAGKRKRKRCPKPGHVKCTLAQELEEDRKGSQAESFDARIAVRASVCILMLQPALSALEYIGRPCGERWDFWEVYSGCGNFTAAALAAGLVVGPPVDLLRKAGGLALDLLSQDNQALLQAVLEEARPRWLHLAPPCTFWTAIGRWTASRTPETWALLRAQAKELWFFALQLAFLQSQHGRKGSLEQLPRCASWWLRCSEQFYVAWPDWQHCSTTSGHLVHTACVTQSPGLRGKKCKDSFRMLTWGNWHAEDVSVFAMVGSKDKSRAAHGMGSGAQPLLGSTLCRCVRRWLLSCGWKSALCHNATVPAWHAHNARRPGQARVGSLAVALLLGHTHSCS